MAHSVYFHLPFCLSRCSYCDFFSTEQHPIPFRSYREALLREWEWRISGEDAPYELVSVYVGGGTPSLWPAEELMSIIEPLQCRENTEITIEVNPGDATPNWFRALVDFGVNRFSIGAQSFDDGRLKWLGRRHTVSDAVSAVEWAKEAGAEAVNVDLIYGTPGMTLRALQNELERAVAKGAQHISAYELTVSPGTPLSATLKRSGERVLGDDRLAQFWRVAGESLAASGLDRYEVSNYAGPGYRCRHNQHYWRGGFYFGLGAGAHGFLRLPMGKMVRYANVSDVDNYLYSLREFPSGDNFSPVAGGAFETISSLVHAREKVMLGLRTEEGVTDFEFLLQKLPGDVRKKWLLEVDDCVRAGLVRWVLGSLCPTPKGMLIADLVAERFF